MRVSRKHTDPPAGKQHPGKGHYARGEKQSSEGDAEHGRLRFPGLGIPTQRVGPGDGDVVDLDGARLGQAEANVIPVVLEPDARLVRRYQGEEMVLGALKHALEDRHVRDDAAGIEVLEALEDDVVADGGNGQFRVARVDGAPHKVVVR